MKVKVRLWGIFQEIVGERELTIDTRTGATIGDLFNQLISSYGTKFGEELFQPGTRKIRPYVKVLLNGHGANPSAKLREGDVVAIFPPVGGG
jgi:molybdopterin synthase sulfur carrier subunit